MGRRQEIQDCCGTQKGKILADQIILEKSRGEDRKYRIVMVPRKVRFWLIRLYWRNHGEKTGNTGLLWYPER